MDSVEVVSLLDDNDSPAPHSGDKPSVGPRRSKAGKAQQHHGGYLYHSKGYASAGPPVTMPPPPDNSACRESKKRPRSEDEATPLLEEDENKEAKTDIAESSLPSARAAVPPDDATRVGDDGCAPQIDDEGRPGERGSENDDLQERIKTYKRLLERSEGLAAVDGEQKQLQATNDEGLCAEEAVQEFAQVEEARTIAFKEEELLKQQLEEEKGERRDAIHGVEQQVNQIQLQLTEGSMGKGRAEMKAENAKKIEELNQLFNASKAEIQMLQSELAHSKELVLTLENELTGAQRALQIATSQASTTGKNLRQGHYTMRKEYDALKESHAQWRADYEKQMEEEMKAALHGLQELATKEVKQIKQELKTSKAEVRALKSQLDSSKAVNEALRTQLAGARRSLQFASSEAAANRYNLQQAHDSLKEECETLKQSHAQWRADYEKQMKEEMKAALHGLQELATKEVKQIKQELNGAKAEVTALQSQLHQSKTLNAALKSQLTAARRELETVSGEATASQRKLQQEYGCLKEKCETMKELHEQRVLELELMTAQVQGELLEALATKEAMAAKPVKFSKKTNIIHR